MKSLEFFKRGRRLPFLLCGAVLCSCCRCVAQLQAATGSIWLISLIAWSA